MTEDKIMLSLSDINILGYDTPISIHLSVADIIGEFTYDNHLDVRHEQHVCLVADTEVLKRKGEGCKMKMGPLSCLNKGKLHKSIR